tara:strand:- start:584 stop:1408 length:825 start_codon:yes stop_codon:yes gene_type:complete
MKVWKIAASLCAVAVVLVVTVGVMLGTYSLCVHVCYTRRNHTVTGLDRHIPNVFHNREQQVVLLQMLQRTTDALSAFGVTHWMMAGNLLGFERHGGLIPWDDDIDIAIPGEELEALITHSNVLEREFHLKLATRRHGLYKLYSVDEHGVADRDTFIDLFTFSVGKHNHYHQDDAKFIGEFPEQDIFPLRRVTMQGVKTFAPKESTFYLNKNFGKSWPDELFVRPPHSNSGFCTLVGDLIRRVNKKSVVYPNTPEIAREIRQVVHDVALAYKSTL